MDDFNQNSDEELTATGTSQVAETDQVDVTELFRLLDEAQRKIDAIRQLLAGAPTQFGVSRFRPRPAPTIAPADQEGARIIEGTFDGQNMVGPDGKQYSVPANYASKSKLVEGDVLKLTITRDGSFIYKQIGPVDRQRLVGTLGRDETTGEFKVDVEDRAYKVLLASITYFKGDVGDEVVILVPIGDPVRWAAVENIIKKGEAVAVPSL